jgi:nitrogen fixation/metabolism regulation signal transduction histidine kinase
VIGVDSYFDPFSILANTPVAISAYLGPELTLAYTNPYFHDKFDTDGSFSKAEFLMEIYKEVYDTGNERILKEIANESDGTWWDISVRPLIEGGRITGVAAFAAETTEKVVERMRNEESNTHMLAQYKFMGMVFDSLDISLTVVSYPDIVINLVNKATCLQLTKMLGAEILEGSVVGKCMKNLLISEASHDPVSLIERAGASGTVQTLEPKWYKCPDGTEVCSRNAYIPVVNNGIVTHVVISSIDITNEVKLSKAKEELLTTCSHELRTPLTVILANLQLFSLMYEQWSSEKRQQNIDRLVAQTKKMGLLISDLLDFSQLSSGRINMNLETICFDCFVSTIVDCFAQTYRTHQFVLGSLVQCEVLGDPMRLEQVLHNILFNAVRYSDEGSCITVDMALVGDEVQLSVIDNGCGISREDLPKLFTRYFRSLESKTKTSGMGIGLYVSYEIVRLHGGTIQVESELGSGTTFTVVLPAISGACVPDEEECDIMV